MDELLNLAVLELHDGTLRIATGVVLGQNLQGLVHTILADKPARRLREPPDTGDLDDRRHALDERDGAPGPVVGDGSGAPANGRDHCEIC